MTLRDARLQAIATASAAVILFIGLCHEFVGSQLFPWGPALFGGPIGWHALGISAIVGGLALFVRALGFVKMHVVWLGWAFAIGGFAVTLFAAFTHGIFHLFALTLAIAGVATSICARRMTPNMGEA